MKEATFFGCALDCTAMLRRAGLTQAIELLRVHRGEKPAVRLVVDDDEQPLVAAFAERTGLTLALVQRRQREERSAHGEVYGQALPEGATDGALPLYLGAAAAGLAAAETAGEPSEALGLLLGLPLCCARAYQRLKAGATWLPLWLEGARAFLDPWGNVLAGHVQGWTAAGEYLPCRYDCAATAARMCEGDALLRGVGLSSEANEACVARRRTVLMVADDLLFLAPEESSRLDGRTVVVGPRAEHWRALIVTGGTLDADEIMRGEPGSRLLRFRETA